MMEKFKLLLSYLRERAELFKKLSIYLLLFILFFLISFYITFPEDVVLKVIENYVEKTGRGRVTVGKLDFLFPNGVLFEEMKIFDAVSLKRLKVRKKIFSRSFTFSGIFLEGKLKGMFQFGDEESFRVYIKNAKLENSLIKEKFGIEIHGTVEGEANILSSSQGGRKTYHGDILLQVSEARISGGKFLELFEIPPAQLKDIVIQIDVKNSVGEIKVGKIKGRDINGELTGRVFLSDDVLSSRVAGTLILKFDENYLNLLQSSLPFIKLQGGERELKISITGPFTSPSFKIL